MNTRTFWLVFIALVVLSALCRAHDQPVHAAIAQSAFLSSDGVARYSTEMLGDSNKFLSLQLPELSNINPSHPPIYWVTNGAYNEDDPPRFENHFYTLVPVRTPGLINGLSDWHEWPFPVIRTTNSYLWGTSPNIPIPFWLTYFGPSTNIYNWGCTRQYELDALTNSAQTNRDAKMAEMFYSLGHILHLNQDLSQPDHVRNDEHFHPWHRWIENFGSQVYLKESGGFPLEPHGWPYWQNNGFSKILDFWDRGLYRNSSSDGLDADARGDSGAKLGLAEFSNGNFIGEDATYAEFFPNHNNIHYFPFPSLADTTQRGLNQYNLSTTVKDTVTLENRKAGDVLYVSKTKAGINITHHSAIQYLAAIHPSKIGAASLQVGLSINDSNVLQEYHSILIPKAIEYSAGILDYFFRGTFNASIVNVDTNVPEFTVSFLNTSSQDFSNGTFYIFQSNSSGVRSLVAQTNLLGLLPNGILTTNSSVTATFLSLPPTNVPTFLYQGTIGISNGVPQDPVDAGIAIAVAPIQVLVTANPLWTDSGFAVSAGQTMTITASGTWDGGQGPVTGDGLEDGSTDLFLGGVNHDTLIAYVGTNPPYEDSLGNNRWGDNTYFPQSAGNGYWLVGTNAQITTDRGGELWFLFNDDAVTKAVSDNSGALTVQISVKGN